MNYTENYHLPQWDEDDRILRTDFNQMCENMETGLNAVDQRGQASAGAVEKRTFDRLGRLAYNQYCLSQTLHTFPRQMGVTYRDTAATGEGLTGLTRFDGYYRMNCSTAPDADALFACFNETEQMMTSSGYQRPLVLTFTAPCNGTITRLSFQVTYKGNQVNNYPCILTYTDLTEERVVKTVTLPVVFSGYEGTVVYPITEPLIFHQNHQYKINILSQETYYGVTGTIIRSNLTFTHSITGGEASAKHIFRNPEDHLGLLVIVSYGKNGPCQDPALFLNGQELSPWWTRTVSDGRGNSIQEAVFRRNEAVEDGDTAQLKFFCDEGGELTLYNWGVVLL